MSPLFYRKIDDDSHRKIEEMTGKEIPRKGIDPVHRREKPIQKSRKILFLQQLDHKAQKEKHNRTLPVFDPFHEQGQNEIKNDKHRHRPKIAGAVPKIEVIARDEHIRARKNSRKRHQTKPSLPKIRNPIPKNRRTHVQYGRRIRTNRFL